MCNLYSIKRGRAAKRHVTKMYIGALLVAGFASFFPGRLMWHWLVS